jgi:hypothetical protein
METFCLQCYADGTDLILEVFCLCFPSWICLRRFEVQETTYHLEQRLKLLVESLDSVIGVEGRGILDRYMIPMNIGILGAKLSDVWEVKNSQGGSVLGYSTSPLK